MTFSTEYLATGVSEILRAAKKDKPKSDGREIDANGNQIRTDAADLVLDEGAWLAQLHSLQGRDLPSHIRMGVVPSFEPNARPADLSPTPDFQSSWPRHGKWERSAPDTTDGDDLYLDDAAWTAHLHSLQGRDLPPESFYLERDRAFFARERTQRARY